MTRAVTSEALSITSTRVSSFLTDSNPSPIPTDTVTAEWWKVLEGAELMKFSIATEKENSVHAKWTRLKKKVTTLTRGRSEDDDSATNLAIQHWLEALDATHRYGHNLQIYFEEWKATETKEVFFRWLDSGEGKDLDLEKCPRSKLQKEQIVYLGPKERKPYEVVCIDGKFQYKQSKKPVEGDQLIFVLSPKQKLYVGQKEKGRFQHSSFLAGGPALAAGRLTVRAGVLTNVEAHSGHYRPTEVNFNNFVKMLKTRVDLTDEMIGAVSHDEYKDRLRSTKRRSSLSLSDTAEERDIEA